MSWAVSFSPLNGKMRRNSRSVARTDAADEYGPKYRAPSFVILRTGKILGCSSFVILMNK